MRKSIGVRRWFVRWWPVLPLLAIFLGCGSYGLDFGHHWDEPWFFLPVKRFAQQGRLLPGSYNYPSLSYYLSYAAGLPELLSAWLDGKRGLDVFHALAPHLDSISFRLRTRALFLAVTAAAVPSVYGAILAAGRSRAAAAVGALAVVASFEVAYHARWIAPDGPLLAASAFTTWALIAAERAEATATAARWRAWAAVGAGLATGTKYTAGLLIVPVVALSVRAAWRQRPPAARGLAILTAPVAVFAAVYLITTPATLFEADVFLEHIEIQMQTYGGGFGAYTVGAGLDHLGRMLLYLGGSLWSPYPIVAFAMTGVTIGGAVVLVRRTPWLAATVLVFPLMFVAYFSLQRTMIVRNLLVVVPPLAVALACGFDALRARNGGRLVGPTARRAAAAATVGLLAVNLTFVIWAAHTVHRRRDLARFDRAAARFVDRQPDGSAFVSDRVRARFARRGLASTAATATVARQADVLVFETDEGFAHRGEWPAHFWGLTETWFGPYEVNFDRYPTWDGDARILVVDRHVADRIGLPLLDAVQ